MNLNHLLSLLILVFSYTATAQCPNSVPGQLSGTWTNMLASDTTAIPVYTTNPSGLPNTEFVLIQNDSIASDGFGPRILASTLDGRAVPSDYGLSTCNELCVVPFSYNLSQLRTVVDSLFGAIYVPGTTCCDAAAQFFTGLCDTLNVYGISSGADVSNLNDVITVMSIFAGTQGNSVSLTNLILTIDQLNQAIGLFGSCAGGVTELCYSVMNATTAMDCYTVALPNSANSVNIMQDTVWIAPGGTVALTGSFMPLTANDTLMWSINLGSSIMVDPMTGLVTAGSVLDTGWVVAQAVRGCATDVTVVIVVPGLASTSFNMTETPLQVLPNPFSNQLQVRFYAQEGDYQLQLIGLTGQVFHNSNYTLNTGNQYLEIDAEAIPNGYYFLRIIGNNTQGTQAIFKN